MKECRVFRIRECISEERVSNYHKLILVISYHHKFHHMLLFFHAVHSAFCACSHWNYMYFCSQMFVPLPKHFESSNIIKLIGKYWVFKNFLICFFIFSISIDSFLDYLLIPYLIFYIHFYKVYCNLPIFTGRRKRPVLVAMTHLK